MATTCLKKKLLYSFRTIYLRRDLSLNNLVQDDEADGLLQEEVLAHVQDYSAEQFDRQRTEVERDEQSDRVAELVQQNLQLRDEVRGLGC